MVKQYKLDRLNALKKQLKARSNILFTNYRGLNVYQMNNLRNTLRGKGAGFHVVKNRAARRALSELGYDESIDQFLIDPTAVIYFDGDITEIAKILVNSSKETTLSIKGGMSNSTTLFSEDIVNISQLPTRHELIAQTVGLLSSPITGLVYTLNGVSAGFVRTLKAVEEKKKEHS